MPSCFIASAQLWKEQEVVSDTTGDPKKYNLHRS